jgi:hypothetical protein
MLPEHLRPLFWDIDTEQFDPKEHPQYTIGRILELGDMPAIVWMRENFTEVQILSVLESETRLSRKSANFWALIYGLRREKVASLGEENLRVR